MGPWFHCWLVPILRTWLVLQQDQRRWNVNRSGSTFFSFIYMLFDDFSSILVKHQLGET